MTINDPATVAEVTAAVHAYEAALMSNDLDALDGFFWRSPLTIRLGVSENLHGFDEIAAFRVGRVGGSPARVQTRVDVLALGEDVAVAHVEFKRDNGQSGRQSQTWLRTPEGWRVCSAHVSLLQGAPDQREK